MWSLVMAIKYSVFIKFYFIFYFILAYIKSNHVLFGQSFEEEFIDTIS